MECDVLHTQNATRHMEALYILIPEAFYPATEKLCHTSKPLRSLGSNVESNKQAF
jgi:hypothetical protein